MSEWVCTAQHTLPAGLLRLLVCPAVSGMTLSLFMQGLEVEGAPEESSDSEDRSSSEEEEDGAVQNDTDNLHPENSLHLGDGVLGSEVDDDDSEEYEDCEEEEEEDAWQTCSEDEGGEEVNSSAPGWTGGGSERQHGPGLVPSRPFSNFSHLVQREELLEVFRSLHTGRKAKEGEVTIGLVGWKRGLMDQLEVSLTLWGLPV